MFKMLSASVSLVALLSGYSAFAANFNCAIDLNGDVLASGKVDTKNANSIMGYKKDDGSLVLMCGTLVDENDKPVGAIGCMIQGAHGNSDTTGNTKHLRLSQFKNKQVLRSGGWASLSYAMDSVPEMGMMFVMPTEGDSDSTPVYGATCNR